MEKTKIIIDCDPGHDDAIAILVAGHHPAIDLLALTTVAGNQTLNKTAVNALHVCEHLELSIPVYAGMPLPLVREQVIADNVHGESGLDGPVFEPLHTKIQPQHAVNYLIETLLASDGDITLVPIGPLTNIATAMRMEPRILPKIQQIVLMGGAYGTGNFTPSAEFNIFADPEAANIVFRSGVKLTMMGLDLTNQTICTSDIIQRMESIGNKAGRLFGDIMRFTLNSQKRVFGLEAGPVHDVTCIAYLVAPELFTTQDMNVVVDINRGPCYGRTVCDTINCLKHPANCTVGTGIDLQRFWDLVAEAVARHN